MDIKGAKKSITEPAYDSSLDPLQYYKEICQNSFDTRQWQLQYPTQQQQLVDAGFCYTPTRKFADCVHCFVCGESLAGWDACADPYEVHLDVSPNCTWLKESRDKILQATKHTCRCCPSKFPSNNKLHEHIREFHNKEPTSESENLATVPTPTPSSSENTNMKTTPTAASGSQLAMSVIQSIESTPLKTASAAVDTAPFESAASSITSSVEHSAHLSCESLCEESGRELGCTTPGTMFNDPTEKSGSTGSQIVNDGFSQTQIAAIHAFIKSQVESEMQRQDTNLEERLYQKMQENNKELVSMLAKHLSITSQAPQQTINEDSSETSTSTAQPTPPSSIASMGLPTPIRPEEVGYFDPDYQPEQEANAAVVSVGKYVWFRDVYMFVNRLKDFVAQGKDIKSVITSCLRGSALMWYLMELSEEDRARLRDDAGLENCYTLLIGRFKVDSCTAMDRIFSPDSSYSLATVKHTPPRVWVYHMTRFAKAAGFESTHSQLNVCWSQLHPEIQIHLRKPQPDTSLTTFLGDMERHVSLWIKMADRQSSYDQLQRPQPPSHSQQYDHQGYSNDYPQDVPIDDGMEEPYRSEVEFGSNNPYYY